MLMNRTKSSYLRVGLWGEPPIQPMTKNKSFIVRNRSQSSLLVKPNHGTPPRKSNYRANYSKDRNNEKAKQVFQIDADFSKIQDHFDAIFMVLEDRLNRRITHDEKKKELSKEENQVKYKQVCQELELMLVKYGERRTDKFYETSKTIKTTFFKNIKASTDEKTNLEFIKFKTMINERFQHSFSFAIDLFKDPDNAFLSFTDHQRNHPLFNNASQFRRQIIFFDFIENCFNVENFINSTFKIYNKDLANLTERIKSAKNGDHETFKQIKPILREYLYKLNFKVSTNNLTISDQQDIKINEKIFANYFTNRLDSKLNNLKIAYMFYQIYKKSGEETRALDLIMLAIDANINTITVYLEFYIKYFQIFEYITELFPSSEENNREDTSSDQVPEKNENTPVNVNNITSQQFLNPANDGEKSNAVQDEDFMKTKILPDENENEEDLDKLNPNILSPTEKLNIMALNLSFVNEKTGDNKAEPQLGKTMISRFATKPSAKDANVKINERGSINEIHKAKVKSRPLPKSPIKTHFQHPAKTLKGHHNDLEKLATFPKFFDNLIDFRTRFEYIQVTYKYLMAIFSPTEIKEMLFEVAEHAMKERRFSKAEIYFTFIIYMFENIDVFELYKNKWNREESLASSKESIQKTYNILKLNEKLFFVNNYYISICIRTKNFSKALMFIINNHFIYKNSMKMIDQRDPCKYTKKNPNTIILQSFSEYHLNLEEKILFRKLFNFFKENYSITLEHHKVLWNKIKLSQGEVSMGLFCHFRDILDKLEALYSYDRKSYVELLRSIKEKKLYSSFDPYASTYIPFYLGYMKKKDHLRFITNKIFEINKKYINPLGSPHKQTDRQKNNLPNSLKLNVKQFMENTRSYMNKRENQIKEEDIITYLNIVNEDKAIVDLIFRRSIKYLYGPLIKNAFLSGESVGKWIVENNWRDESSQKQFNNCITHLQTKILKYVKMQQDQKKTQEHVKEGTMRPIELKKKMMRTVRNKPFIFVNEIHKRYIPKQASLSQFYQTHKDIKFKIVNERELDSQDIFSQYINRKPRIRNSSFDDNQKEKQFVASMQKNSWKLRRNVAHFPSIQDPTALFRENKNHTVEFCSAVIAESTNSRFNSSKQIFSSGNTNSGALNSIKKLNIGRPSNLPNKTQKRLSNKFRDPTSLTEKQKLRQHFKRLKDLYEKDYINQKTSMSKIVKTPFTFNDIRLLNQEEISINFMVDQEGRISFKVGCSGLKYFLNKDYVTFVLDENDTISNIFQQTLKDTNFEFYTIIPIIHYYFMNKYKSLFSYEKDKFEFHSTSYERRIQEHFKKMGLVYDLILIEFDKIKLEYLEKLDIGLYNEFDLCYLQAFFFIVKYLAFFLNKAKKRSPIGMHNIDHFSFDEFTRSLCISNCTAKIYVTNIYVERLLFYSIQKQKYFRFKQFSAMKLGISRDYVLDLQKEDFVCNLIYLVENLINSIFVQKMYHEKNGSSPNLKVYLGCKHIRINETFLSVMIYVIYDHQKLDDIANKLKGQIKQLRAKLEKSGESPPDDEDLFQVLLIKIAKKIMKFGIEIKPLGAAESIGFVSLRPTLLRKNAILIDEGVCNNMEEFNENLRINFYHFIFMCICPEKLQRTMDFRTDNQILSTLYLKRHYIESLIIDLFVFPFESRKIFEVFDECFDQINLIEYITLVKKKQTQEHNNLSYFTFDYKKLFRFIGNFTDLIEPFIQHFFLYPKEFDGIKVNQYSKLIAFYETVIEEGIHKTVLSKKFQNITIAINSFFEKSVKNLKRTMNYKYNPNLLKSRQSNAMITISQSSNKYIKISEKNTLFEKNFPNIKREMQLMIYMKNKQEDTITIDTQQQAKKFVKGRKSKISDKKYFSQTSLPSMQSEMNLQEPQDPNLQILDNQKFQIVDDLEIFKPKRNCEWVFQNGDLYARYSYPSFGQHKLGGAYICIRGKAKSDFLHSQKLCFLSDRNFYVNYLDNLTLTFYDPKSKWPFQFIIASSEDLREVSKLIDHKSEHFETEFLNKLIATHSLMKESNKSFTNNILIFEPHSYSLNNINLSYPVSSNDVEKENDKTQLMEVLRIQKSKLHRKTIPKYIQTLQNHFRQSFKASTIIVPQKTEELKSIDLDADQNVANDRPVIWQPANDSLKNNLMNQHLVKSSESNKDLTDFELHHRKSFNSLFRKSKELKIETIPERPMEHDGTEGMSISKVIDLNTNKDEPKIQIIKASSKEGSSSQNDVSNNLVTKSSEPSSSKQQRIVYFDNLNSTKSNLSHDLKEFASLRITFPLVNKNFKNNEKLKTEVIVKKNLSVNLFDALTHFNFHSNIECLWDPSVLTSPAFKTTLLTNNSANFRIIQNVGKFECFTTKLMQEVQDLGMCQISVDVILFDMTKWANSYASLKTNRNTILTKEIGDERHFYNSCQKMTFINSQNYNYFEAVLYERLYSHMVDMRENFMQMYIELPMFFSEEEIFFVKLTLQPLKYCFLDHIIILNSQDFLKIIEPRFWRNHLTTNQEFATFMNEFEQQSYKSFFILFMENFVNNLALQKFQLQSKLCLKYPEIRCGDSLLVPNNPSCCSNPDMLVGSSELDSTRNLAIQEFEEATVLIGNFNDTLPTDFYSHSKEKFLKPHSKYIKSIGKKSVLTDKNYAILNFCSYTLFEQIRCEVYFPKTGRRCLFEETHEKLAQEISNSINLFIIWLIQYPFNKKVVKAMDRQSHQSMRELFSLYFDSMSTSKTTFTIHSSSINNEFLRVNIRNGSAKWPKLKIQDPYTKNFDKLKEICNIKILYDTIEYVLIETIGYMKFKTLSEPIRKIFAEWKNSNSRRSSMKKQLQNIKDEVFYLFSELHLPYWSSYFAPNTSQKESFFFKPYIAEVFRKILVDQISLKITRSSSASNFLLAPNKRNRLNKNDKLECILTKYYVSFDFEYQIDVFLKHSISHQEPKEDTDLQSSNNKSASYISEMTKKFCKKFQILNNQTSEDYEFKIRVYCEEEDEEKGNPKIVRMNKKLKEIFIIYTSEHTTRKGTSNNDKISLDMIKKMAEFFVKTVSHSNQHVFSFFGSKVNLTTTQNNTTVLQ